MGLTISSRLVAIQIISCCFVIQRACQTIPLPLNHINFLHIRDDCHVKLTDMRLRAHAEKMITSGTCIEEEMAPETASKSRPAKGIKSSPFWNGKCWDISVRKLFVGKYYVTGHYLDVKSGTMQLLSRKCATSSQSPPRYHIWYG